mgnify:CR=1 FL=1
MRKKKEQSQESKQESKGEKFDQGMNVAQKVVTLLLSVGTLVLTTMKIMGKNRNM